MSKEANLGELHTHGEGTRENLGRLRLRIWFVMYVVSLNRSGAENVTCMISSPHFGASTRLTGSKKTELLGSSDVAIPYLPTFHHRYN